MCDLQAQSAKAGRGVGAPARFDPATPVVSFSTGMSVVTTYSAVLSSDGKSLANGKWTESKKETEKSGQSGMAVVSSGEWSAKLAR